VTGDPLSKAWIPYFGMRGKGRCCDVLNYKWRVVYSPFAFNKFTDPILFHCRSATQAEVHQSRFTLEAQNGRYIQGDFEALFNITQSLALNAWATGSWMRFTGEGKSELNVIASTVISNTGTPALHPGNEIINHATFTDSWYAGGLSLDLRF